MIITLLTDFGTRDVFAGVVKGVIKGIAPDADVIDLTHKIPAQDIAAGAFALKSAVSFFPAGTIHMAVVDPGVGGTRRPVAARIGSFTYVCPDNGILSFLLQTEPLHHAVTLDNTHYRLPAVSRTFHGRDIFAPAAAHLAQGVSLTDLGTPIEALVSLPLSQPHMTPDAAVCHVLSIDVFGNVITDMTEEAYDRWGASHISLHIGETTICGPLSSYSDAALGQPLALFGSSGHLEIAIRNGSAAKELALQVGDRVTLQRTR